MKIQLSIIQLQNLIDVAKQRQKSDAARSNTIEIEVIEQTDTHEGTDKCKFWSKSIYAECDSVFLGTN